MHRNCPAGGIVSFYESADSFVRQQRNMFSITLFRAKQSVLGGGPSSRDISETWDCSDWVSMAKALQAHVLFLLLCTFRTSTYYVCLYRYFCNIFFNLTGNRAEFRPTSQPMEKHVHFICWNIRCGHTRASGRRFTQAHPPQGSQNSSFDAIYRQLFAIRWHKCQTYSR